MKAPSLPVEPASAPQRPSPPAWSADLPPARVLVAVAVVVHLGLCWVLRGFVTDDAWFSA